MKKTIATLLGIASSLSLYAADPQPNDASSPGPEHGPHGAWHHHGAACRGRGNPLEDLTQMLNLTDDQKAKIQPIIDASKPQVKAIVETQRAQIKAVMDNVKAQVRPLLTPEQQQVLDDMSKLQQDKAALRKQ